MRLFQQESISGLNDMEDDNTPELPFGVGGPEGKSGIYSPRFLDQRPSKRWGDDGPPKTAGV